MNGDTDRAISIWVIAMLGIIVLALLGGCTSAVRIPWVYSDLTTVRDNGDTIVFAGRVICAPSDSLPFIAFHYELRENPTERSFMKVHEDVHVRQSLQVGCVKHALRYGADEQYRFKTEFEAYCAEIQARVDAGFVKNLLIDTSAERIPYVYQLSISKEEVRRQLTYHCVGGDGRASPNNVPELRQSPRRAGNDVSVLWGKNVRQP